VSRAEAVEYLTAAGATVLHGHPTDQMLRDLSRVVHRGKKHSQRQHDAGDMRQCDSALSRKKRYPTPDAAQLAIKRAKNPWLHAYHCQRCGSWHIGNAPTRWRS
jgi:hypothetical protein